MLKLWLARFQTPESPSTSLFFCKQGMGKTKWLLWGIMWLEWKSARLESNVYTVCIVSECLVVSVVSGKSWWAGLEHQWTEELSEGHRLGPGGPQWNHQYPLNRKRIFSFTTRIFTWPSLCLKQPDVLCHSLTLSSFYLSTYFGDVIFYLHDN